jgi:hypothetical protein
LIGNERVFVSAERLETQIEHVGEGIEAPVTSNDNDKVALAHRLSEAAEIVRDIFVFGEA